MSPTFDSNTVLDVTDVDVGAFNTRLDGIEDDVEALDVRVDSLETSGVPVGAGRTVNAQTLEANGAVTLDVTLGAIQAVALEANATSSVLTNAAVGDVVTVQWAQDVLGARTYVWPANCKFMTGAAPVASAVSTWRDSVTFWFDGVNWNELSRAIGVR